VGDSDTDIKAGAAAGIRTIKVEPNGDLYRQLREQGVIEERGKRKEERVKYK
jgi:phosphoglycolate phosphatase-like HAD superfamily hydrolase